MINGIKPKISTQTKLNSKSTFDEAMINLCEQLHKDAKEYFKGYRHTGPPKFMVDGGRKYLKVCSFDQCNGTDGYETKGRIHCFVHSETGDIYKPATWKAPQLGGKNDVRGNIFDPTTYEKTDPHGGWLYQR